MRPFDFAIEQAPEILQLELIDLQASSELKHQFRRIDKLQFYGEYADDEKFPNLKQMTMRILATLGTTYVCKSFFSMLKIVKTKNRSRLAVESMTNELRCAATKLPVDFKELGYHIQKQVSH